MSYAVVHRVWKKRVHAGIPIVLIMLGPVTAAFLVRHFGAMVRRVSLSCGVQPGRFKSNCSLVDICL